VRPARRTGSFFGHVHAFTEQQMKDLTALLMDPASPVNQ
jgi:hypothetical protein